MGVATASPLMTSLQSLSPNPQAAAVIANEEEVVRGDQARHVLEARLEAARVLDEWGGVLEEGRDLGRFRCGRRERRRFGGR